MEEQASGHQAHFTSNEKKNEHYTFWVQLNVWTFLILHGFISLEEASGEETLKGLLQFWTGYPQLPRDTSCQLWVKYCPEQSSKVLAEADTCTVTLRIPTIHQHYEDFKKFMDCSIAHGKVGFGRM